MNYHRLLSKFYYGPDHGNGDDPGGSCLGEASSSSEPSPPLPPPNANEIGEYGLQIQEEIEHSFDEIDPSDLVNQEQTIAEPLLAEDIRWFYKAADGKLWIEFNGYDSLLIESSYRKFKISEEEPSNELEKVEIDKVEIGVDGVLNNVHYTLNLNDKCKESPVKKAKRDDEQNKEGFNAEDKITVRGGMYEVDLSKMLCESIYWPGENYAITRGLYFYDGSWQPLEKACAEVLEEEHLKLFGSKNDDAVDRLPSNNPPATHIHSHHFSGFHVEWLSASEIYLFWGGAPRQIFRSVSRKFGFNQTTGYRLRRGYCKRASLAERPVDITHVVFVIHGIGQKMDAGRIIRNTNALRANCEWLRSQWPALAGGETGRAELFPAKWLAGERGDAAKLLAAATPKGTPVLRRAINEAAMDIMYYTSPIYGKLLHDNLTDELNRLYTMFMARNPNYKGHFSAVAHSLGCVILYDIITEYRRGCEKCTVMNILPEQEDNPKLMFKLEQIFCLGSPLGVFLALRQSTSGTVNILPTSDTRVYNIFHLSDPVAYRLEPLFAYWLSKYPPVEIPHYSEVLSPSNQASPARSGWKIWSLMRPPWQSPNLPDNGEPPSTKPKSAENSPKRVTFSEVADSLKKNTENALKMGSSSILTEANAKSNKNYHKRHSIPASSDYGMDHLQGKEVLAESDRSNFDRLIEGQYDEEGEEEDDDSCESSVSDDDASSAWNRKPEEILPYRLDYTFRDSFINSNYISAITSHTSYWTNYDIASFILSHLNVENDDPASKPDIS